MVTAISQGIAPKNAETETTEGTEVEGADDPTEVPEEDEGTTMIDGMTGGVMKTTECVQEGR